MKSSQKPDNVSGHDPFGCHAELQSALFPPDSIRSEYDVAHAIGRCILFGVALGRQATILTPLLAGVAADQLLHNVSEWVNDTHHLAADWNNADTLREADELCIELVEARMETWAVYVAINDVYSRAVNTGDTTSDELRKRIDELNKCISYFDRALQGKVELLSTATETNLLKNWRAALAKPCDLPWWLEGSLEAAADEVSRKARGAQLSREAWRKVYERAGQ